MAKVKVHMFAPEPGLNAEINGIEFVQGEAKVSIDESQRDYWTQLGYQVFDADDARVTASAVQQQEDGTFVADEATSELAPEGTERHEADKAPTNTRGR